MNYRHAYHAGNFADILKHLVFVLCLESLRKKDKGFFILDAHGGAGVYNLRGAQASKTGEAECGILKLVQNPPDDPAVALYLQQIIPDLQDGYYPGSPLLAARSLRLQDRLSACELHPEDYEELKATLAAFGNARAVKADAYQTIRASLPPKERRGLVLIDPPFEKTDEFQTLGAQIREWKKRWETGIYLIWYPIKPHLPLEAFYDAVFTAGFKDSWICEAESADMPDPDKPNKLIKTGVALINPPYQVPERMEAALAALSPLIFRAFSCRGARN